MEEEEFSIRTNPAAPRRHPEDETPFVGRDAKKETPICPYCLGGTEFLIDLPEHDETIFFCKKCKNLCKRPA